MKSKKLTVVPDDLYEVLGFTLPFSNVKTEYQKGESITEYIGGTRIDSLKRESRYRVYYPKLNSINLLTLNYPSIPQNIYQKISYIKKIIRRNIVKKLVSLSPDKKINESLEKYVNGIISPYGSSIKIKRLQNLADPIANTACSMLNTTELFCLSFSKKQDSVVYTDPFAKKLKDGYYYLKSDPTIIVHIIDLPDFLVDILLVQTIHHIQTTIQFPVIQNVFENFIQSYSETDYSFHNSSAIDADKEIISSLTFNRILSDKLLFLDYDCNGERYFKLGLSVEVSAKLTELFCRILEVYQDIQYENRYRDEICRTIATAYMTKKNIPQKVLSAMEHTAFRKYFKYVEFDEDVDLNAVEMIEKEFKVLNEAYFSSKAFFNVTLRFRKLGKHKARGLYYPSLHTLCVDLRSPASFIHEYFHMIDDQLGDLSLDVAFQNIVDKYKEAFLTNLRHLDSGIQGQLNGRGKYNLQYFFRRAEIFARCGEIYFVRILKIESSLIQPDLKYAYPQSESLDILIKNYYEELLNVKLKTSDFNAAI